MKQLRRILWAVDPLEDDKVLRNHGNQVMRDFAQKTKVRVEPVYVLSDGLLGLSVGQPVLLSEFKEPAQRALDRFVKQAKIPMMEKPRVLVAAPSSRATAAVALDRYAAKNKADIIFVNSHGRKGLGRAFMGSFAETLVLHAKTPVLISGPKSTATRKFDHILFPTDFSKESKKGFEKVKALAKKLGAKITIFNAVVNPMEPFVQAGVGLLSGAFVSPSAFLQQDYNWQKSQAQAWIAEATKSGVKVHAAFDPDSMSAATSILAYAQRNKLGLIAMASESSAVSAAVLGSLGRVIAREAPCPVLLLRAN